MACQITSTTPTTTTTIATTGTRLREKDISRKQAEGRHFTLILELEFCDPKAPGGLLRMILLAKHIKPHRGGAKQELKVGDYT